MACKGPKARSSVLFSGPYDVLGKRPALAVKARQRLLKAVVLAEIGGELRQAPDSREGQPTQRSAVPDDAAREYFETRSKKVRGMARASIELIEAMSTVAEAAQPITGRGIGYKLFTHV